jgi:hypothetical protein
MTCDGKLRQSGEEVMTQRNFATLQGGPVAVADDVGQS